MADKLTLELVSPERMLVSAEVDEIYASGSEGDFGLLPGHVAMFCSLRTGEFRYRIGDKTEYAAVDGGFLEVVDDKVVVLADGAELGSDINLEAVLQRKLNTEEELEEAKRRENVDLAKLEAELRRNVVRINVAGHYNK